MTIPQRNLWGRTRELWNAIRALCHDGAYDRYLQHHALQHPGATPLSRRDFYLREQQRKWSGVSRCC